MYNNSNDLTIRNCYNSSGEIISESDISDFKPLSELLEMFGSLRSESSSVRLEEAG